MIIRKSYRAYCKGSDTNSIKQFLDKSNINTDNLLTLSLFKSERDLFLYYEAVDKELTPDEFMPAMEEYLMCWPGEEKQRYWVPMMDIFHYNKPVIDADWRKNSENKKAWGRIARLKPEMVSSYIYYHFQYQEEKPGDGDKYGIINLHENLMFFYAELPAQKEAPQYRGLLQTNNTPKNWGEVMAPHFILWEDEVKGQFIWKETESLLRVDNSAL